MKKTYLSVLSLAFVLSLAACGSKDNNESSNSPASASPSASSAASPSASAAAAPAEVKKIVVGTGTQFPQVCFIDKDGKLTGFDVEVVREIDKRLPQYEFDFQSMDFSNLLLSLDTKKIDFVAHEMGKDPEREEKYLFNKEPYAHWKDKVVVASSNNDNIKTLDDLKGKSVLTTATSEEAQILLNYNKDHNNAIKIIYTNGAANDAVQQITSGRVYATIGADFTLSLTDPQHKLKTVGGDLEDDSDILFVFRKDDPEEQKLADAVDGAIKEIRADGTLSNLSKQWLGQDFTS